MQSKLKMSGNLLQYVEQVMMGEGDNLDLCTMPISLDSWRWGRAQTRKVPERARVSTPIVLQSTPEIT